jgi:hypothetical protein
MDSDQLAAQRTRLSETFPCLRDAPGVSPWDPIALNLWAPRRASHGERVTAQFLLGIRDPSADWEAGRFDLMEALRVWPASHRDPFLRWATDPWWP